jgi:hypothetical protein
MILAMISKIPLASAPQRSSAVPRRRKRLRKKRTLLMRAAKKLKAKIKAKM